MKNLPGVTIVAIILSLGWTQIALCDMSQWYYHVTCNNGYQGAFEISVVDNDTGCVATAYGVDCHGKYYQWKIVRRSIPGDLSAPYDRYIDGITTGGAAWWAKISISDTGVATVWGVDAGGYYEGVLADQ
ncbi:MAG: hypothetical protein ABIR47_06090 [Candidatus Kapaibacterium sp.]